MANLYLVPDLPGDGACSLTGDVAHHLLRVVRVRRGDELRLTDGRGAIARVTVADAGRDAVAVAVLERTTVPPTEPAVTIAFACPRGSRADWLFEHGTEVGVAAFQPLWTERSRPQRLRVDRWRKLVAAATGQCARAFLPKVHEPLDLDHWLAGELPPTRLLADPAGAPLQAAAASGAVTLLVGPEGGFTDGERDAIAAGGFAGVRFAPHILRTETAALVGAAVLLSGTDPDIV